MLGGVSTVGADLSVVELIQLCRSHLAESGETMLLTQLLDIERHPTDPYRLYRFGQSCRELGYNDLWRQAIVVATLLPHTNRRQVYYRGQAKLTFGDWSGWRDCEERYMDPEEYESHSVYWRSVPWCKKAWDGEETIRDHAIFVIGDGDGGDCLQMLRFVPSLAAVTRSVILGVAEPLISFAQHNFGKNGVTVVARDSEHSLPYRRYAWIRSLPALIGGLPRFEPLSSPAPRLRTNVGDRRLQAGLCWATGLHDRPDTRRNIPFGALVTVFGREAIQWHGVHVGGPPTDSTAANPTLSSNLSFDTYSECADMLSCLDCLVTTDTSVAHLAGSIGVRTILLLSCGADARWGIGYTTPWYPSISIIRQSVPSDWKAPIAALVTELDEMCSLRGQPIGATT
jgi:hypothetical protein